MHGGSTRRRGGREWLAGVAAVAAVAMSFPSGVAVAAEPAQAGAALNGLAQAGQAQVGRAQNGRAQNGRAQNGQGGQGQNRQGQNNQGQIGQGRIGQVLPGILAELNDQQLRDQAAAQQAAAEAEAERREREQAAAAAAAARLARATARAQATWRAQNKPNRLVVVRQASIDVIEKGRLVEQVRRSPGAVNITTLDRQLPARWLTVAGGAADLTASILLTAGTTLTLGGDVETVRLAGGAEVGDAASIFTGRGRLNLRDVTVRSHDPDTDQPVGLGPGRPYIAVTGGGRIDSIGSTVADLGTPVDSAGARAGVGMSVGSTGSFARTTFAGNTMGLRLDRTQGVKLDDVTVRDSRGDGVILRGDRNTTLVNVKAESNDGNGVLVSGLTAQRPITGITATGNKRFGIALLGQKGARVDGVSTSANAVGGVRVSFSQDTILSRVSTTDDPIGVYTHVGSANIGLNQVRLVGARRGLQVEKTTRGLSISNSLIERAATTGVAIGGKDVFLDRLTVNDSGTGVRVERGAGDVTAAGLTVNGGGDGFVALTGTTNVRLRNLTVDGASGAALRTASSKIEVVGSRLMNSPTGILTEAAATISASSITGADTGIRTRSPEAVTVDNVDVSAFTVGINAAAGSPIEVTNSRIDAIEALRGSVQQVGANTLSLPPLNLIAAIGVPLILLALILEQVSAFRQGTNRARIRRRDPPGLGPGPAVGVRPTVGRQLAQG